MTVVDLRLGPRPDEPGPPISRGPQTYSDEVAQRLTDDAALIVARYPEPRSALLPLLHLVQAEDGYLTPAGIAFCAALLKLSAAEVTAVATFYSMYRRTPTGEFLVGVCTNTLCAVMGGDAILEVLEDHLDVHAGQTTGDGKVTLEHLECNAACDYAPVMMVNWEFFDNQTPSSATELVDDLRAGRSVTPTRGAPLCTFRETARILAGFADQRPGANDGPTAGDATLAGLRVARERDMSAPEFGETGSSDAGPDDDRLSEEAARDARAPGPSADLPPTNGSKS